MSTRKLSVLVTCLVLGVVLCLRWYLEAEAPVHAGPRDALETGVPAAPGWGGEPRPAFFGEASGPSWRELSCRDAGARLQAGA